MSFFNFIRKRTKHKSIFCGLESSGKSTIISFLETGQFVEHTPTMGKNLKEIEIQGTRLNIFDMGGQSQFRKMWLGELSKDTKVIVYIIDRADVGRFDEAKQELQNLVPIIKKDNIKLLIFANKSDLPNAAPIDFIYEKFNLEEIDSFEIMEVSAKTGYGMADAFIKFYSELTGKMLTKTILAAAISIYYKSGIPVVTRTRSNSDLNQNILEGGFLSAITAFADLKMGNTAVKFEGESGTFIVQSSEKYIGALLWTKNLKIPKDESANTLNDLLCHLESNSMGDEEEVAFYVEHYCSNLM